MNLSRSSSLLFLAPSAVFAQGGMAVRPVTGTIRDAGVYHLAAGTWTRSHSPIGLGADVIYNSTAPMIPQFFAALAPGERATDEGRIPSPNGPSHDLFYRPGCDTSYHVNGFQLGYCTDRTSVDCRVRFVESYMPCTDPDLYPTLAALDVSGLPGSSTGSLTCWTVTIDLQSPPQTTDLGFVIMADGDGHYDASPLDRFGWSVSFPNATSGVAGPLLSCPSSSPSYCNPAPTAFDGTIFDPIYDPTEAGMGMSTSSAMYFEYPAAEFDGCYPHDAGAFYLRLYANVNCPPTPGTSFCAGDGSGAPCPCGNASPQGFREGCQWSSGLSSGLLFATGAPSLSADTLILHGAGMPSNTSALYFQGTDRQNAGLGATFGDGLRCASGAIVRLATKAVSSAGTTQFPSMADAAVSIVGQVSSPSLCTYQVWFRHAANYCTPSTFNLTNGWQLVWSP